MAQPTQPTTPVATQMRHPWRSTLRTAVAVSIGLLSLVPAVAAVSHLGAVPGVGLVLTVSAAVTRVLALPAVEDFLHEWAPWLAAQPPAAGS